MEATNIVWKCGNCLKVFESNKKLLRHLDQWHNIINCKICGKHMKKGSMFVHAKRFHTQKEDPMDLTDVNNLNKLDQSIQELISYIDSKEEIFQHPINMEDYMKVFDESTTQKSITPTEEFNAIHQYWLNLSDEEFLMEEENLLEWAAQ